MKERKRIALLVGQPEEAYIVMLIVYIQCL